MDFVFVTIKANNRIAKQLTANTSRNIIRPIGFIIETEKQVLMTHYLLLFMFVVGHLIFTTTKSHKINEEEREMNSDFSSVLFFIFSAHTINFGTQRPNLFDDFHLSNV